MSNSKPLIQCPNPDCYADNPLGQAQCDRCKTPLVYRHLWAIGPGVVRLPKGALVGQRYRVVGPQIWLETQPGRSPEVPPEPPDSILPYLHLYPHRLHLPTVYGLYHREGAASILLLDNVPIDHQGKLLPALATLWPKASPVRQLYWLWQILQLWQPLQEQGVAASLLNAANLRVEGWRVRLRELYIPEPPALDSADPASDPALDPASEASPRPEPTLSDLAKLWQSWLPEASASIGEPLQALCQSMQTPGATLSTLSTQLNQLLLEQAAQLPIHTRIAGASVTGPQRAHNEDTCYPLTLNARPSTSIEEVLLPHFVVVCDGIGGHAGGEVASQLAVRSLQIEMRAMLAEIAEETETVPPEVIIQQLEALIRVINNLIASQNDTQGRESRQRMGTTLVMALQLPQKVATPDGFGNAHELYLAHVGDSRAYWITPQYCHPLTMDDDVATREIRMGRSFANTARTRPDAAALTQALGTRDSEFLRPTVQRFILEEDGLLLLCSDGLSDNNLVERSWEHVAQQVFKGQMSVDSAVQFWLDLSDQHNGHDNTSLVLLHCLVSREPTQLLDPIVALPPPAAGWSSELSDASRALLYGESDDASFEPPETAAPVSAPRKWRSPNPLTLTVGVIILLFAAGAISMTIWRQTNPSGFQETWERILTPSD